MKLTGPIAGAICLLLVPINSSIYADEPSMTAIQLLTTFTGENAAQYESQFRFSEGARIVGFDIHAVGMENTTAQYSGQENVWYEVNNILRITTADGFEGVSGVDTYHQGTFSDEHLSALKGIATEVASMQTLDPVVVSSLLEQAQPNLSDEVRASIDIALWDLAARKAGRPLHEILGAKRNSIEPYASLPFYASLPEYIEAVHEYAQLGYRKFKFHVWGSLKEDLRLVETIQQTFADDNYEFMIDLESMYELEDAVRLGREMDKGLFRWFEAPISDELTEEYAVLRNKLEQKIIPAGYNIYSAEFIREGIEAGAWDFGRFDATVVGGLSTAIKLLTIANEADLTIDIQSWGHSLAQVANLHLMLANERTLYFEAPMPKDAFEFGMTNGNLLVDGRTVAPEGPGLGVVVDWNRLQTADFYVFAQIDVSGSAPVITQN